MLVEPPATSLGSSAENSTTVVDSAMQVVNEQQPSSSAPPSDDAVKPLARASRTLVLRKPKAKMPELPVNGGSWFTNRPVAALAGWHTEPTGVAVPPAPVVPMAAVPPPAPRLPTPPEPPKPTSVPASNREVVFGRSNGSGNRTLDSLLAPSAVAAWFDGDDFFDETRGGAIPPPPQNGTR